MKILLLGKEGQIGWELQRALSPLGIIDAHGRSTANLLDLPGLEKVLEASSPAIIVNAAAYTDVDNAESNSTLAHSINAIAVELMAKYAKSRNALLVHYSTDYVFDGIKVDPYLPDDQANPKSVYGMSKLAGELAIQASGCEAIILRTSWVFSTRRRNFIKTILELAQNEDQLRVVADQFGAPTSADLVADITCEAILGHISNRLKSGIYHATAAGFVNWHGLAQRVIERSLQNGADLRVTPDRIVPITTEEYHVPAIRPKNSRLDTMSLQKALGIQIPHWSVHTDRIVDELTSKDFSA